MEAITVEQGLSSNNVNALYQDRQGFLWIGTDDGLNRYDGYGCKIFRQQPGDSTSLPNNFITAICEDREGLLWVGTNYGLCRFDKTRERFFTYHFKEGNPHSIGYNSISFICEDRLGQLWIGTAGGGLNFFDQKTQEFSRYYPDTTALLYDQTTSVASGCLDSHQDDLLWVGVRTGGHARVYAFHTRDRTFAPCDMGKDWSYAEVFTLSEDHLGTIWAGVEHGAFLINKASRTARKFDVPNAPTKRTLGSVVTRRGQMLLAAYREGLYEYDPAKQQMMHYPQAPLDSKDW